MQRDYVTWRTSTRSGQQGNCVAVAKVGSQVGVCDTKDYRAGHLAVDKDEWTGFLASLKA